MVKFREVKTGRVWYIHNPEHIKHFRHNPRFKEIVEKTKKESKPKATENVEQEVTE